MRQSVALLAKIFWRGPPYMLELNVMWLNTANFGGAARLRKKAHELHMRAQGVLLPGGRPPPAPHLLPAWRLELEAVYVPAGQAPGAPAARATEGARQLLPPPQPMAAPPQPPQTAVRAQAPQPQPDPHQPPPAPGLLWPGSLHG